MRQFTWRLALILCVVLWAAQAMAEVKPFKTVPGDDKNLVRFESDASIETVVGTTSHISGSAQINPDDLMATTTASFEVDMASLKTGLSLRDQHMRENHLHTKQFPAATFTLKRFISSDKAALNAGETAKVVAEGDLNLHGVTKTYQIPLTLFYDHSTEATQSRLGGSKGDILSVSGEWAVKLPDHNIPRPQFLLLRLAEEQKVSVNIALTDTLP